MVKPLHEYFTNAPVACTSTPVCVETGPAVSLSVTEVYVFHQWTARHFFFLQNDTVLLHCVKKKQNHKHCNRKFQRIHKKKKHFHEWQISRTLFLKWKEDKRVFISYTVQTAKQGPSLDWSWRFPLSAWGKSSKSTSQYILKSDRETERERVYFDTHSR